MAGSDERVCSLSIKNIFSDSRLKFTMLLDKGKWTEEEIDMLCGCVHRFAIDLNKLHQHTKNRTVSQKSTTMKKKVFVPGLSVRPVSSSVPSHVINHTPQPDQGHATAPDEPETEQRAEAELAELIELSAQLDLQGRTQ